MSTLIYSVTHGLIGLEFNYTLVLIPMLVGLVQARASWGKFLMLPLAAIAVMLVVGIANELVTPLLRIFGIGYGSGLHVLAGMLFSVSIGYPAGRALARRKASSEPEHRRGAVVGTAQPAARGLFWRWSPTRSARRDGSITLADIPVPLADETKHFKLIGTTGTGKSTAIRELLKGALARGDRAIIADPDGGYLNRFYDPDRGDVILNPFDGDARKWDLFGEIVNNYDIEQLARSLIPDSGDSERIWSEYARTFFTEVMRQSIRVGTRDDRELYRLLKAAPHHELKTMLAGTAAGPFLEEGSEKMFGSLRSVASSAVRVLEYTTEQQAESFSVRQWVRQGAARNASMPGRGGVLFIPYTAGQIAALRSVISAWMRLAIFEAMDCGEGDQLLWFVIDELDALGEIDGLKDALARLRKFGGRCVIGLQSIAQLSGTYGKSTAATIVENCGNTVVFRCSASEHGGTSEFASKLIGQREVLHTTQSKTRRALQWLPSTTSSQQLRIEPAVMASEIERLPDLTGFLKLASIADWQRVSLTLRNDPIVPRPRRPVVVSPPAPVPVASPAPPPPTDSAVAVASPPAPLHRGKSPAAKRKAAASKRARKRPQQAAALPGDELHDPMASPPPVTPAAETEVVRNRAAGAESSHRSP